MAHVRGNVELLTTIHLKEAGYASVIQEIEVLEANTELLASTSMTQEMQRAIDRLSVLADLDKSRVVDQQMRNFPNPKARNAQLPRAVAVLFASAKPAPEDIAAFLPDPSEQLDIRCGFLAQVCGLEVAAPPIPQAPVPGPPHQQQAYGQQPYPRQPYGPEPGSQEPYPPGPPPPTTSMY